MTVAPRSLEHRGGGGSRNPAANPLDKFSLFGHSGAATRDHTLLRATCLGAWSQDLPNIAKTVTEARACCRTHIKANTMAPALGEKKFLCEVDQQGNRKQGSQMSL